ncbi:PhzF family phenazine biosynthesis protein [Legionella impletisoli]|uniref:Phenazine biosynthesis protein n=1 Tax=Legionella impletisoli TaxID=343510 RepID=A0A917N9S6_9GAMM|nr:PhzF family phenazine biosynthesis protein [Legionella impletisoli]GGI75887.1 phenazine biosynthesis protein [Legionella impletisoli]
MHNIDIYQIDAFTDKVFHGNPAAVCLLTEWLNDELLQAIAVENNLSETAFILEEADGYQIRWFTPKGEINLCGHATLAAGFLLFELDQCKNNPIKFSSLSGPLYVRKKENLLVMEFPRLSFHPLGDVSSLENVVNVSLNHSFVSELDYMVVLPSEKEVLKATINFQALAALPKRGLILTSRGSDSDFYSRCFYPKHNILEDPVTGSAHCVIAPYWSEQLNKKALRGIQGGVRKGELFCEVLEDRVNIAGYCRWYFKGSLLL